MSMLPKSDAGRKATAMVLWGAITMTIGWSFMHFTTPTDDQLYDRLSPDLRRQFDRERKSRREANDRSLQQVFDQRNLDRPAWRTDVPDEMRRREKAGEAEAEGEGEGRGRWKQELPMSVDSDVAESERAVKR